MGSAWDSPAQLGAAVFIKKAGMAPLLSWGSGRGGMRTLPDGRAPCITAPEEEGGGPVGACGVGPPRREKMDGRLGVCIGGG